MVYKKYIKRGGKIYGPYNYHSKRVNGKVVTSYVGPASPDKKSFNWSKILLLLGVLAV